MTLQGKRVFAGEIELRISRWEDGSGSHHNSILIRGGGRVRVRGAVTTEAEVGVTGGGGGGGPRAKDAGGP